MNVFPDDFPDRNVCVIGLGYVGLTLATTLAEVGFTVYGLERRADVVDSLRRGIPHIHEPGLGERLSRAVTTGNLILATEISEWPTTAYIITVGTPLDESGRVRLDMVENAAAEVASVLKPGDLVVMRSTVKLGTTRKVVRPILERSGVPFHLAFCPERTLEGRAMEELRHLPQIVGGDSNTANLRAAQLFNFVTPTVVRVTDVETAELIKLVDNAQRDVAFAYANEVAAVCDAAGVSAAEVVSAGALAYPRWTVPYPGPVGGPCLSKDPHILAESLEGTGAVPEMTMAARRRNETLPQAVADFIASTAASMPGFTTEPVVALLGVAFKGRPATDDLRGTMAVPVRDALASRFPGASFRAFDAEVPERAVAGMGMQPSASIEDAAAGAHIVVILNNHRIFGETPVATYAARMAVPGLIYDFWNTFPRLELALPPNVVYAALGSHSRVVRGVSE